MKTKITTLFGATLLVLASLGIYRAFQGGMSTVTSDLTVIVCLIIFSFVSYTAYLGITWKRDNARKERDMEKIRQFEAFVDETEAMVAEIMLAYANKNPREPEIAEIVQAYNECIGLSCPDEYSEKIGGALFCLDKSLLESNPGAQEQYEQLKENMFIQFQTPSRIYVVSIFTGRDLIEGGTGLDFQLTFKKNMVEKIPSLLF